jgi:hypothetical protein
MCIKKIVTYRCGHKMPPTYTHCKTWLPVPENQTCGGYLIEACTALQVCRDPDYHYSNCLKYGWACCQCLRGQNVGGACIYLTTEVTKKEQQVQRRCSHLICKHCVLWPALQYALNTGKRWPDIQPFMRALEQKKQEQKEQEQKEQEQREQVQKKQVQKNQEQNN